MRTLRALSARQGKQGQATGSSDYNPVQSIRRDFRETRVLPGLLRRENYFYFMLIL
jgi:hypothetical protein